MSLKMPITTFIHKGKNIVYVDCRGITTQPEMISLLRAFRDQLENGGVKRSLVLTDMTNAYMGLDLMTELKGMSRFLEERIEKDAILGLDSFKMIIVNGWNKFSRLHVKAFSEKGQALEYLVN